MLQAKKVSTRFENQIGQVEKIGQDDQNGHVSYDRHVGHDGHVNQDGHFGQIRQNGHVRQNRQINQNDQNGHFGQKEQLDKNGQIHKSGENDQKGHVYDNPSYQVTEINEFDEIGEIGQSDFFVWKIEGLSAYTLYTFRVSVILSVNFPDSVSRIDSGTSRVVRTGLSESVLSPPVFRGIHQVAKQKIMF